MEWGILEEERRDGRFNQRLIASKDRVLCFYAELSTPKTIEINGLRNLILYRIPTITVADLFSTFLLLLLSSVAGTALRPLIEKSQVPPP